MSTPLPRPAASELVGGRFELLERAGAGGMSEVWKARDRVNDAIVALKLMLEGQEAHEERFSREAAVLAELSHPAIVRYVAHGLLPDRRLWMAMEWLEGEDLSRRLRRGPLSLGDAIALARRVAGALATVHESGIVHRDLKPANLFLAGGDARGVKVLDFGIARLGDRSRVTRTGTILGTPGYMAPEQLQSGVPIGPETDVFALGCVLFESLAGRPTWTGDPMPILAKILFEEAPRLAESCPEIPEDLDDLVARMLEKDPRRRPRSGAELLSALEAIAAAPPSTMATSLRVRAPSLGDAERRVVSLVLVGALRAIATASGPTLQVSDSVAEQAALRTAVTTYQGRLVELADGSSLVTIAGERVATDQAACAARCAIALKALVPADVPIVVATGRGERGGQRSLGEAVDRAARLAASAARGMAIVIDEVTAGLLDARFEIREREGEGLDLLGERAVTQGARTLLGKPTACVGRDRELRALTAVLDECIELPGAAAALITAPAGVGKSRLAHELVRVARERHPDVAIWFGRGDPLRAGSGFDLIGQAIRSAASIRGGEPIEERRKKLVERGAQHVPAAELPRMAALLGELAGVPFPDDDSPDLRVARQEPALLADAMRKAFLRFVEIETEAHPVLLVLEDLHWGDATSARLVDTALRDLSERPFMALALARPEVHDVHPRLWADRKLDVVRLTELGKRASERLVRQVLGESVGPETIERLVNQAGGHAFYLEELIRSCAEGRTNSPLPETVLAMVEARLAGLDDEARRALRAASVFGEVFWEGGVAALLGDRAAEACAWLRTLVDREVLIQREGSRFDGERELAFRHALLREGAYATLTDGDRALGHRLAAAWLGRAGEADPIVLAEHHDRGGEGARAVPLLARGAMRALVAGDTDELMARARRGLALVNALPASERAALRDAEVELLGLLVEGHGWRAEWREAFNYTDEILALATPGTLPWTTAATGKLAMVMFPALAPACAETLAKLLVVDLVPGAGVGLGQALIVGAYCLLCAGRTDEALAFVARAEAVIEPVAAEEPAAAGWMHSGRALRSGWIDEDPWTALRHAETSAQSFQAVSHIRGLFVARFFIGVCLSALGAREAAASPLRATAEAPVGYVASQAAVIFANDLCETGEIEPARALGRSLLEAGRAHGFPLEQGRAQWMLAIASRAAGELEAAEREAREAIATLAPLPFDRAGATATLAAILLDRGDTAAALEAAREAMESLGKTRSFGYFGDFARHVHAAALIANGRRDEAREALAAARARVLARADGIADPAMRAAFLASKVRAKLLAPFGEHRTD